MQLKDTKPNHLYRIQLTQGFYFQEDINSTLSNPIQALGVWTDISVSSEHTIILLVKSINPTKLLPEAQYETIASSLNIQLRNIPMEYPIAEEIPANDLILYVHLPHKTNIFESILKSGKIEL